MSEYPWQRAQVPWWHPESNPLADLHAYLHVVRESLPGGELWRHTWDQRLAEQQLAGEAWGDDE